MKGIIYEYYNHSTGMYYIGQTRVSFSKRDWEHRKGKGVNSYFDRVYHKHPDQFTSRIILELNLDNKELLVKTLNIMEITYISHYKFLGRKLYNILKGGNLGFSNISPTTSMLEALKKGRDEHNAIQRANKYSPEEIKARHRIQSKLYSINNPEKYREIYTKANQRRNEAKRQWYLNNRERILAKQREKYANEHSLKPS